VVLAEGIREAYSDLFAVNKNAHELNANDAKNKLRALYKGSKNDRIIGQIAKTFEALCSIADFSKKGKGKVTKIEKVEQTAEQKPSINSAQTDTERRETPSNRIGVESLQYHINIVLPESRDQAVYDAIFKSMKEHLR